MPALFGAAPPKQPQPSPASPSAYIHACATTVCASDHFPLPLLSRYEYEERGVRYRRRRRRRRRRRQRRRRRRLRSGFAWGGGVAHACARTTAAATGGGGVVRRDVATRRWRWRWRSVTSRVTRVKHATRVARHARARAYHHRFARVITVFRPPRARLARARCCGGGARSIARSRATRSGVGECEVAIRYTARHP